MFAPADTSSPPHRLSLPAWFARVGLPFDAEEQAGIIALKCGLDIAAGAAIAGAASWWDAAQFIRADAWDSRWWDAEEEERERLWGVAAERLTEEALLGRLTSCTGELAGTVRIAATFAASRAGVGDPELIRAAIDAALLAAHQQALAELAMVDSGHYFRRKFELFAAGRWPLGVCAGRYVVF